MSKQVTITANPKSGKVFTPALDAKGNQKLDKNGKPFGYIRVESAELDLGFAYNGGMKKRSVLISMSTAAAEAAMAAGVLTAGAKQDGHIVREDSLEKSYDSQRPLQAPKRDEKNNIIEGEFNTITSGGAPVYRNEYFTKDLTKSDVRLASYDKIATTVNSGEQKAIA